jgi:hypothetical protein
MNSISLQDIQSEDEAFQLANEGNILVPTILEEDPFDRFDTNSALLRTVNNGKYSIGELTADDLLDIARYPVNVSLKRYLQIKEYYKSDDRYSLIREVLYPDIPYDKD